MKLHFISLVKLHLFVASNSVENTGKHVKERLAQKYELVNRTLVNRGEKGVLRKLIKSLQRYGSVAKK